MALNLISDTDQQELRPRIIVFGVGGAGGNAVNNMIEQNLEGADFVVANTDAQALQQSRAAGRIQMGLKVTQGLGAGARPQVGAAAAEETIEEIVDHLAGAHMCFITAGMGGGTGTGAAPVIAQAARELGVLTIGVVTKPFQFEGTKRMRQAEEGILALQQVVDTLIIIPNQNLFRLANDRTTFTEAFSMADDVLYQGVKGVTDLMVRPGIINLDFADVRSVMDEMGKAMMGTGEATGEDRAKQAAEKAIANPLLDEISLNGARGVLINVTGGPDMTLFELDEAASIIREKVDENANIIIGSTLDPDMEGSLRVSVVATGIDATHQPGRMPVEHARTPAVSKEDASQAEENAQLALQTPDSQAALEHHIDREPRLPMTEFSSDPESSVAHKDFETPYGGEISLPPAIFSPYITKEEHPAADILPEPAYRAAQQPAEDHATSDVRARLQASIAKASDSAASQPPSHSRHVSPTPPQPAPQRTGFGIGSLINRVKGTTNSPESASHARNTPPTLRPHTTQAAVNEYNDEEEPRSHAQDRIEIPAFLRRQAN